MTFRKASLLFVLTATVSLFAAGNGYKLFQQGLAKERAEADLRGAIQIYEQVIKESSADRKLVAQALLRIGECRSALGDPEAQKTYQRLVRDFSDQSEQVAVAQARLGAVPAAKSNSGLLSRKLFDSSNLSFPYEALSPDGRHLAYPRIQPGPRGLMLRDVASGAERQLTDYGMSKLATTSIFSRDGRMIAFRVDKKSDGQDLRVIGIDGTGEKVIFENEDVTESHPKDWSPDGKTILATLSTKDRGRRLATIALGDGSIRTIKTSDWQLGSPDQALFSLDGRYIVYDQLQQVGSKASDIFLLASDGSREVRLVEHPADDQLVGWAPDGRMVFTSDRSGTRDLYALRVSDGVAVGGPELIQRNIPGLEPRITSSGALHYIDFHKANGAFIAGLDTAKGKLTAPPVPVTETTRDLNWTPAFSADGSQVAVISFRGVGKIYIIIKSLKTNDEREIYVDALRVGYDLLWYPDGKSLLIRGNDSEFHWGIHRLDLSTGRLEKPLLTVQNETSLGLFALSPDGAILYYAFSDASSKVTTLKSRNLRTGEERDLYAAEMRNNSEFSFTLAPGGQRIALIDVGDWTREDSATWELLDVESGATNTIPNINRETFAPVWTPDEKFLLFESNQRWFRAGVDDGEVTDIGPTNVTGIRGSMRMHPDGKRLAFFTVKEIAEFWVLENLFPTKMARR